MLKLAKTYINDSYGSKRGLLNATLFQLQYRFGVFGRCETIDWPAIERLVFVCSGNICRSPLADYYARSLGLRAESFGLHCGDDFPADPRAIEFAFSAGIDLAQHRTRNISTYQPSKRDLVVVMEPDHLKELSDEVVKTAQVTLLGLWLSAPVPYIHDPFSTDRAFFDRCESDVVSATSGLARYISGRRQ